MAANTSPVFPGTIENVIGSTLATANTAKDGTGTVVTVFTGDATNGSRLDYIQLQALGTNVATVLRVFLNNGSDPTVAANNALIREFTISATTLSEVAALANNNLIMNWPVKPGYKINLTIGTTVAAGLKPVGVGGHY